MGKVFRYVGIPLALAFAGAAALEVDSANFPGGGDNSQRLDRYQDGTYYIPTPGYKKGAKEQCLVEKPDSQITYTFGKSSALFATQFLFGGQSLVYTELGAIPDFKTVNLSCDQITNVPGRKWDNFEAYKADNQDSIAPIREKLAALANEEDTSRFSTLYSDTGATDATAFSVR